jgi:hypothetical protein
MHHVVYNVPAIGPATEFLALLGFEETARATLGDRTTVVLLTDSRSVIEFIEVPGMTAGDASALLAEDLRRAAAQHAGLLSHDLDAEVSRLEPVGHVVTAPAMSPYGLRFRFARLPGGGWIELLGP